MKNGSGEDDFLYSGAEGFITELVQRMFQKALGDHPARRVLRNAA